MHKLLVPVITSALVFSHSATAQGNVSGWEFSGQGVAYATADANGNSDLFATANADLTFGVDLGGGIAGIGLNVLGFATDGYADMQFNPYGFFSWQDNTVTVGYIGTASNHLLSPFHTLDTGLNKSDYYRPLGARYDTTINGAKVSASYSEDDLFSVATEFRLTDNIEGYAAVDYRPQTGGLFSQVGINTQFNDHDIRLAYSCFGDGYHSIEGEVAYDFTDRISGSVYAGFDFGMSDIYTLLAGRVDYKVNENITLSAGAQYDLTSPSVFFSAEYRFR